MRGSARFAPAEAPFGHCHDIGAHADAADQAGGSSNSLSLQAISRHYAALMILFGAYRA